MQMKYKYATRLRELTRLVHCKALDRRCMKMTVFGCYLLIAGGYMELLKLLQLLQHVAYYTRNGLIATVYLKWFTCDANSYLIEMFIY